MKHRKLYILALVVSGAITLAASFFIMRAVDGPEPIKPTAALAMPTATFTRTPRLPTPTPRGLSSAEKQLIRGLNQPSIDCIMFDGDVSIPDGSSFSRGTTLEKIWRFQPIEKLSNGWTARLTNLDLAAPWVPQRIEIDPTTITEDGFTITIEISIPMDAPQTRILAIYEWIRPDGSRCGQIFWFAIDLE